jgi:hypothetical protein
VTVRNELLPRANLGMTFLCCPWPIEVILSSSCPGVVAIFRAYGFNW